MRALSFDAAVHAEIVDAATAKGCAPLVIEGVLTTIGHDIARTYDDLTLRPPEHPERRIYVHQVEALGLVEPICEARDSEVRVVIRLRVEAFA